MGEDLTWHRSRKFILICVIFSFSSVCSSLTHSSILGSVSSGRESHSHPLADKEPPDRPLNLGSLANVALRTDWSTKGWKPGPVTLKDAFGIKKGTIVYPKFQAVMPAQVASSKSNAGSGAGGGMPSNTSDQANAKLGQQMAAAFGWTGAQWTALNNIVMAESGWDTTISNGGSHGYQPGLAYGIPQALPGSKMASAGADWQTNPRTQIRWMLGYIKSTYGDPVRAWQFHLANGWY